VAGVGNTTMHGIASCSDVNKDLGPKAKDLVLEATDPHQTL